MSTVNERLSQKVTELQLCIACLIQKAGGRVTITEAEAIAGAHIGIKNIPREGAVEFVAEPDENYRAVVEQCQKEMAAQAQEEPT